MRHIESAILQELVLITSVFGSKRGIVNWLHAACGICKSWQIAFKTLLKNKLTSYIASSPTTAGHTGFHKWNGLRSFTFLWIFQEGQNLISTCEGWGEGSQWRTDIKRISKINPPIYVFICETNAHLMGLSDDFDDCRIKERRVIDGPVTCSHIKDGE